MTPPITTTSSHPFLHRFVFPSSSSSFHYRSLFRKKFPSSTSLYEAIDSDDKKTFEYLLHHGHDLKTREEKHGGTVLHAAVLKHAHEILAYLLSLRESESLTESRDNHQMTPLHIAAGARNLPAYRALLNQGAHPESIDQDHSTPLHLAAESGAQSIVQDLLLNRKVHVDCRGEGDGTPLHFAAKEGHLPIAELLIRQGHADVDARTNDGSTPLHLACYFRRKNMVIFLVDEGHANIHLVDHQGQTLLHAAAAGDPAGIYETFLIEFLLEKSVQPNIPNKEGRLPRDLVTNPRLKRLLDPDRLSSSPSSSLTSSLGRTLLTRGSTRRRWWWPAWFTRWWNKSRNKP
jgi:ankyrin repeat protein